VSTPVCVTVRILREAVLSFCGLLFTVALAGCGSESPEAVQATAQTHPERLSQYGLFVGTGATQEPVEGVIPYDLNSALFSDYALKYRFLKLPPGMHATYSDRDVFEFPVGTVIAKTFAYPRDARDPSQGSRMIETRILERKLEGWIGLPYIWNAEQTEATLELAGGMQDVQWIHGDGKPRTNNYIIPNANQCKGCHKAGETVTPIGPKARHLNREIAYASGVENQLDHWSRLGALSGAPPAAQAPKLAVWDDPKSGTLEARARAWLEINCAHCHNPDGPARSSGLNLLASQQNPTAFGIYKPPVAAGRGSGGREFDIVPGQPDKSILVFRIDSTDAGIMMPELGKRLVHKEGLALVREWIAGMTDPGKTAAIPRSVDAVTQTYPRAEASTTAPGSRSEGALDGNRFSIEPASFWKGRAGEATWWWQIEFPQPRDVGAILQVHGDHEYALRDVPRRYIWQASKDGKNWEDLKETATSDERRMYRIHRLGRSRRVRCLRLAIAAAEGDAPALREVEFFEDPRAEISFPPWAIVVSTTGSNKVPGEGAAAFRRLARSCDGWGQLQFQNVWLGDFHEQFAMLEPRPLCGFLSGNFIDWCQQDREHWRGTAEILKGGRLPLWASCGGAQGLAILEENGVDQPWDCPQCRNPEHPLLPIYTHIAGSVKRRCGDYTGCVFERGPNTIRQLTADPVFRGLPIEFRVMESHCGQIEWPPRGWELIATCGAGGRTKTQCLRLKGHPIYAAQFHIEMNGTPESSRRIMNNFLNMALVTSHPARLGLQPAQSGD
jgi:uncharacterized repeat protein (TIGR03806 family)